MAPALVTLLIAGSGNSGSLTMAIGLVAMGSVAVGLAATCCGTDLGERSGETMEAMATKTNRVDSSSDGPEPMPEREGEAPAEPRRGADVVHGSQPRMSFALPVDAESGHADRSSAGGPPVGECTRPNTPAPDAMAVTPIEDAAPAGLAEIGESSDGESSDDESIPTESWNRTESDGEVSIEAVTHARFDEGSKLAVVHLPFVPPLQAVPQIECEPLDCGCEVTIKTDAVYRHGVRLSVTRQSAGPAESVPIGVMVYTTAEEPVE